MTRTVEAIVDENGSVHLLEAIALPVARRAFVTILEEPLSQQHETALLSEAARAEDWNRPEEVAHRANEIYRREIRDKVMPQEKGKFLVLDIESGDYEIDNDDLSTEEILRSRHPDGTLFGLCIGYTSAYTLAGRMVEDEE